MHDGVPYDPIQGQGQGHECLKAIQEESTVSPIRDYFFICVIWLLSYWTTVGDTDGVVCPCLWIGTSLGSVLVVAFGLPTDADRNTEPVSVMPSGTLDCCYCRMTNDSIPHWLVRMQSRDVYRNFLFHSRLQPLQWTSITLHFAWWIVQPDQKMNRKMRKKLQK